MLLISRWGLLCWDLRRRWERVPAKTTSKGVWLRPSSGLWGYKHQPLRVTAVPVTIKRNFSVPETSRAGTAPLLERSTGLQLFYMSPVRGKRKERAAVMSSTRELLKKHRYDNKPDIM